jgi:hypothetical protein
VFSFAETVLRLDLKSNLSQLARGRAAEGRFLSVVPLLLPLEERHGGLAHAPTVPLVVRSDVADVDGCFESRDSHLHVVGVPLFGVSVV